MESLPVKLVEKTLYHVLYLPNSSAELAFRCLYHYPIDNFSLKRHARCLLTCRLWHDVGLPHLLETIYSEDGLAPGLYDILKRQPSLSGRIRRLFVHVDRTWMNQPDHIFSSLDARPSLTPGLGIGLRRSTPATDFAAVLGNVHALGFTINTMSYDIETLQSSICSFASRLRPRIVFTSVNMRIANSTEHLSNMFQVWKSFGVPLKTLYLDLITPLPPLLELPEVTALHLTSCEDSDVNVICGVFIQLSQCASLWFHFMQQGRPARTNEGHERRFREFLVEEVDETLHSRVHVVSASDTAAISWGP